MAVKKITPNKRTPSSQKQAFAPKIPKQKSKTSDLKKEEKGMSKQWRRFWITMIGAVSLWFAIFWWIDCSYKPKAAYVICMIAIIIFILDVVKHDWTCKILPDIIQEEMWGRLSGCKKITSGEFEKQREDTKDHLAKLFKSKPYLEYISKVNEHKNDSATYSDFEEEEMEDRLEQVDKQLRREKTSVVRRKLF